MDYHNYFASVAISACMIIIAMIVATYAIYYGWGNQCIIILCKIRLSLLSCRCLYWVEMLDIASYSYIYVHACKWNQTLIPRNYKACSYTICLWTTGIWVCLSDCAHGLVFVHVCVCVCATLLNDIRNLLISCSCMETKYIHVAAGIIWMVGKHCLYAHHMLVAMQL